MAAILQYGSWRSGGRVAIWWMALFPKFKLGLFFIYIYRGGNHSAIWRLAPIQTFVSFKCGAVLAILHYGG